MDGKVITLTIGSHFFKLTQISPRVRQVVLEFAKSYIKYGITVSYRNEVQKTALAVYGAATRDREEFRFHINQLTDFMMMLRRDYVSDEMINYVKLDIPFHDKVDLEAKPNWKPRDVQESIIDYITQDTENRSRFVGLQTGGGKTLVSLLAIAKLGLKTVIVVRPMYIHKWTQDLQKYYSISTDRVMVVQGLAQLQALLMLGKENLLKDTDVIIISNKTMQLYLKLYEIHRDTIVDLGYACVPEDMFQTLKAGIRLIDEVHQDFHLNFKLDLYTNIYRSISLSATLISKDPFMNRVYEIAYPAQNRFKVPDLDKYIDSFSLHYRFRSMDKIKTSERSSNSYSHNAFEESLMQHKDKSYINNYFKLIKFTMECSYIYDRKPGEKLIIFCYKIDFCQLLVDYLKKEYPHLDIRRFTADDPDENMYEPDVRVTTLGSGSTAHDVDKLKAAILTVAVDSVQSNIQALGRLRKQSDFTPRFYYFVCDDIVKHRHYDTSKEQLLKERAKSFKSFYSPFVL